MARKPSQEVQVGGLGVPPDDAVVVLGVVLVVPRPAVRYLCFASVEKMTKGQNESKKSGEGSPSYAAIAGSAGELERL